MTFMMKRKKPLIGITSGFDVQSLASPQLYKKAVETAGGEGVFVSPSEQPPQLVHHLDGFIISGGKDIYPAIFGEKIIADIQPEDPSRIDFEFSLLHEIMKAGRPAIGICYGMQLINVFFKGTLYQDIKTQRSHSLDHRRDKHTVTIGMNPYIGNGTFVVNSSHHQAVKDPGIGINPFAYSPDGIIEAFHYESRLLLMGFQWHPERSADSLSERIFKLLIDACIQNE